MGTYSPIAYLSGTEADTIIDTITEVDDTELADTVASIVEYHLEHQYEGEPVDPKPRHVVSFPIFSEEEHFRYRDYLLITNEDLTTVFILRKA